MSINDQGGLLSTSRESKSVLLRSEGNGLFPSGGRSQTGTESDDCNEQRDEKRFTRHCCEYRRYQSVSNRLAKVGIEFETNLRLDDDRLEKKETPQRGHPVHSLYFSPSPIQSGSGKPNKVCSVNWLGSHGS